MSSPISVVPLAGCREPRVNESSLRAIAQHDKCIIHPNECPYEFVNPLDVDIMIDHPSCNSVASAPIGHCGGLSMGETRHCALTKDACEDPSSFIRPAQSLSHDQFANPDGGSCTVLEDMNYFGNNLSKNDRLTKYVGCSGGKIHTDSALDAGKEGHICVTTIPECRELAGKDESVTINLSDPKCDCSQTKTGACFRMGDVMNGAENFNYFCAATEEVCDHELGLSYQDVNQLIRSSDIDCRLCDAGIVKEYKLATASIPISSVGDVVGISVASTLGVVLLLMLLSSLYSRVRKGTTDRQENLSKNVIRGGLDVPSWAGPIKYQKDGSASSETGESSQGSEEFEEVDVKVHKATYI